MEDVEYSTTSMVLIRGVLVWPTIFMSGQAYLRLLPVVIINLMTS